MASWFRRRSTVLAAQVLALGAFIALFNPAREIANDVGAVVLIVPRIVMLAMGALVIALGAQWSRRAHLRGWIVGVAATIVLLFAALYVHLTTLEQRTCVRQGRTVVIGTALVPRAADHASRFAIAGCEGLLDEFAGVKTDVWTAESIQQSIRMLVAWSSAVAALTAVLALIGMQFAGIAMTKGAVRTTGPIPDAAGGTATPGPAATRLTGRQRRELSEALRAAFDPAQFDELLDTLERRRTDITLAGNFVGQVGEVIRAAENGNWTAALLRAAIEVRPDNEQLRACTIFFTGA